MTANSKIEWTDHTFNPWEGCTKVSPGCDNCYAEARAERFGTAKWGPGQPRRLTSKSNWAQPLIWNKQAEAAGKRARVFCASLADVFDNEVPTEWRAHLFDLIKQTPHLDWLILTKRIGNVKSMLASWARIDQIWPNVWLGISVVNQEEANRDIPKLLATPARIRFLSMEPLLGPVSLRWLNAWPENAPTTAQHPSGRTNHLDGLRQLDWVIVGGESGLKARPMHPDWARSLRDQCQAAGVPFFFKQWGEWGPHHIYSGPLENLFTLSNGGGMLVKRGKKLTGRLLDGREWNEVPGLAA